MKHSACMEEGGENVMLVHDRAHDVSMIDWD